MYFEHLQKKNPSAFKFGKNILINEILNFLQRCLSLEYQIGLSIQQKWIVEF